MFTAKLGLSTTLSPLSLVTGTGKIDCNHLTLDFGSYVQIYNVPNPTNSMAPRTVGAIALNAVGNSKGDFYFLNLETGKRVSRHQLMALPVPISNIQQVHFLDLQDNMPLLKDKCHLFERRPGVPLPDALNLLTHGDDGDDDDISIPEDNDEDTRYHDADVSLNELQDLHSDAATMDPPAHVAVPPVSFPPNDSSVAEEERSSTTSDELHTPNGPSIEPTDTPSIEPTDNPSVTQQGATDDDDDGKGGATERGATDNSKRGAADNGKRGAVDNDKRGATVDWKRGATTKMGASKTNRHHHHLRDRSELKKKTSFNDQFDNPASPKSYSPHLQLFQNSLSNMTNDPQNTHDHICDLYGHIVNYCFNQMSAKNGIAKHGEEAIMALFMEFSQLHNKKVLKAIKASDLTRVQKKNALHALNLIKEKRNGVIKGRTVETKEEVRRKWYEKHEVTSPTISNDSLMALLTVSSAERRKIISWDVGGGVCVSGSRRFRHRQVHGRVGGRPM